MKIEIVKHTYGRGKVVLDSFIFETDKTNGYDAVGKLIDKICDYTHYCGGMIISIGTKHNENDDYFISNQYYDGISTWENDWWEGEPYIRIYGWCYISDLHFYPGADCWIVENTGKNRIYDEWKMRR